MEIYNLEDNKPEHDGSECIAWMGNFWRHVVWCQKYGRFMTVDMDLIRKPISLWFYSPKAEIGRMKQEKAE